MKHEILTEDNLQKKTLFSGVLVRIDQNNKIAFIKSMVCMKSLLWNRHTEYTENPLRDIDFLDWETPNSNIR